MPHDEALADRIRTVLAGFPLKEGEELGEIKMFGGLCFCINRKMLIGVGKGKLMVRLGNEHIQEALAAEKIVPMDFTGKPLRNFAYVREGGYQSDEDLRAWVEHSAKFVREHMLPKAKKKGKAQ